MAWATESTGGAGEEEGFYSLVSELMSPVSELMKKTERICTNSDTFMLVMFALGGWEWACGPRGWLYVK